MIREAQVALAALGWSPTRFRIGELGLVPVIHLLAQYQHDISASGDRTEDDRKLYSAGLSVPLVANSDTHKGFIPSLDIKRSVGADVLQGREKKGQTSVVLSIKY